MRREVWHCQWRDPSLLLAGQGRAKRQLTIEQRHLLIHLRYILRFNLATERYVLIERRALPRRRRYAKELDRLDVEILLNLLDFWNLVDVFVIGRLICVEMLDFGVRQAFALETDVGLLVHHGDGGLRLQRLHYQVVLQVVISVKGLAASSLLAVAALFVFEGGQLQLLDILLPFLQRMQIHVSGAIARGLGHDALSNAALEALRWLPVRVG